MWYNTQATALPSRAAFAPRKAPLSLEIFAKLVADVSRRTCVDLRINLKKERLSVRGFGLNAYAVSLLRTLKRKALLRSDGFAFQASSLLFVIITSNRRLCRRGRVRAPKSSAFPLRTFSRKSGFAADGFTVANRFAVDLRDNNLKPTALPSRARSRPETLTRFALRTLKHQSVSLTRNGR